MEDNSDKYFCPHCRNPECDGVLKIKINKEEFSIDYECDKNKEHKGQNIFFKTFERFYLKEMNKDRCKRCNAIIENNLKYKCKVCDTNFCSSCFIYHKHIKKNIDNILIISTKCGIHKNNYLYYCINCKKYLCNYCLKNKKTHKKHKVKNLYELIPSKQKLKNFEKRLEKYDDLLNKIDAWLKEFNQKIIRLKQNILDEKELLQKLAINFNQSFINYDYIYNFNYIYEYSEKFKSEYLNNFAKSINFETKGKMLFEYLIQDIKFHQKNNTEINKNADIILKHFGSLNNSSIAKIKDNYFLKYSKKNFQLIKYEVKDDNIIEEINAEKQFSFNIYSISICDNLDNTFTVYANLSNAKKIIIFNIDLTSYEISKNDYMIKKQGIGQFYKAIQLPNELVATFDNNDIIDIWIKDENNEDDEYLLMKSIPSEDPIYSILYVNPDYFISSHEDEVQFYDINSLSIEKSLNKIDCFKEINSLALFNEYIIITCKAGFAVINIKTKELVQYIQDHSYKAIFDHKEIIYNSRNSFYILYKNEIKHYTVDSSESSDEVFDTKYKMKIYKLKFMDYSFQILERYDKFESRENLHLNCINHKNFILWDEKLYLVK